MLIYILCFVKSFILPTIFFWEFVKITYSCTCSGFFFFSNIHETFPVFNLGMLCIHYEPVAVFIPLGSSNSKNEKETKVLGNC